MKKQSKVYSVDKNLICIISDDLVHQNYIIYVLMFIKMVTLHKYIFVIISAQVLLRLEFTNFTISLNFQLHQVV